jgi:urea transport system ATP-binding protein
MSSMLKTRGLEAGYSGSRVLQGLELDVAAGEVVALLGRNGVGKSTAAETIGGVLPALAGSVELDGEDVTKMGTARRYTRGLRVMRQVQPAFPQLTVRDNFRLGRGVDPLAATATFAFLTGRDRQLAGTLSGGEQKMLALARLAHSGGRVWVLDEPTEGLQPSNAELCRQLVADAAAQGTAVLLVEQNIAMALSVATRWVVIERGRVVERGDVDAHSRERVLSLLAV